MVSQGIRNSKVSNISSNSTPSNTANKVPLNQLWEHLAAVKRLTFGKTVTQTPKRKPELQDEIVAPLAAGNDEIGRI